MSTDSPAEDLAPSTVGRLNSEEAAPLGIAISGEEVPSRTAARRATTHETLTVLGQIDSGFSPVDSDTKFSGPDPGRGGYWSSHLPPWLGAHQRSPPRHDWRPT